MVDKSGYGAIMRGISWLGFGNSPLSLSLRFLFVCCFTWKPKSVTSTKKS